MIYEPKPPMSSGNPKRDLYGQFAAVAKAVANERRLELVAQGGGLADRDVGSVKRSTEANRIDRDAIGLGAGIFPPRLGGSPDTREVRHCVLASFAEIAEDHMRNPLVLIVGTAFLLAAAMLSPRVGAATPLMPAGIQAAVGKTGAVERAGMTCTHRRVCRQGAGCAWRKVCKRW
jgi:hypothetical protein